MKELEQQVVSKERVTRNGEVFTAKREVNAMLDLVKEESYRIESTFIVGIKQIFFSQLVETLDSIDLHRIIYSFKTLEDKNFGYYGYNKHREVEDGVQEELFI